MIRINIEANESVATTNLEKKEPICVNDVALVITELERFKLEMMDFYDDFERVMVVNEKPLD